MEHDNCLQCNAPIWSEDAGLCPPCTKKLMRVEEADQEMREVNPSPMTQDELHRLVGLDNVVSEILRLRAAEDRLLAARELLCEIRDYLIDRHATRFDPGADGEPQANWAICMSNEFEDRIDDAIMRLRDNTKEEA